MDEKDQKSLTIGDILDQLIKPSVIQSQPEVSSPKPASSLPSLTPKASPGGEISLPKLGQDKISPSTTDKEGISKPPELSLSIRTMRDDLERLKRGGTQPAIEIRKAVLPPPKEIPKPIPPIAPPISKPIPKIETQPPKFPTAQIQTPPVRPAPSPIKPPALPPIPTAPVPKTEEQHYHKERVLSQEEILPPFLGAPIPKKVKKPTEEKVQYGLIARVIGSGMTTGIVSTIVLAGIAYAVIYFTFLKKDSGPDIIATPTPTNITATPTINELETIFQKVSVVNLELNPNEQENLLNLKTFINNQVLAKKEFKRIDISIRTEQGTQILSFIDLLAKLSIPYPIELKNEVTNNNITLLYGQEEIFNEQSSIPKKIVFIVEIKDIAKVSEILKAWERTIANDFKDIFEFDPTKQASQNFLDNDRRGVMIRYKNFPYPDKSIDYAVFSSITGHNYLILSNSRESMYSPTDRISGL